MCLISLRSLDLQDVASMSFSTDLLVNPWKAREKGHPPKQENVLQDNSFSNKNKRYGERWSISSADLRLLGSCMIGKFPEVTLASSDKRNSINKSDWSILDDWKEKFLLFFWGLISELSRCNRWGKLPHAVNQWCFKTPVFGSNAKS